MISALTSHIWQSTFFALAAALLTAAFRRNGARVRYWLWLSGSLKFLIPFAWLMSLGGHLDWVPGASRIATQIKSPAVSYTLEQFTPPSLAESVPSMSVAAVSINWAPVALLAIWLCGLAVIVAIRLRVWLCIRAVVRKSRVIDIPSAVQVRSSSDLLEPGVVGLCRPILLVPDGIVERLTPAELKTVLAHELCHVRRRDNLFAAVHIMVEAMFWFHPLVWWIGARLVEERELACDEEVLSLGNQPDVYAEAILNVCKLYTESPLTCVSGVSGAGIRRRIEAIMANRRVQSLNRAKQILLVGMGAAALAGPVLIGLLLNAGNAPAIRAQSSAASAPRFEVASIKPCQGEPSGGRGGGFGGGIRLSPGRLNADCMTLDSLIRDAYIRYADGKPLPNAVLGKRINLVSTRLLALPIKGSPTWIKSDRYSIAANAEDTPIDEVMRGPMMQALLEERFKLKIHSEVGEVSVYALTVAPGGPKLQTTKAGSCFVPDQDHPRPEPLVQGQVRSVSSMGCGLFVPTGNDGGFDINGTTIANLASSLSKVLDLDVIDHTGIPGMFDIHFNVHPEPLSTGVSSGTGADSPGGPGQQAAMDADRSDRVAPFRSELRKLGLMLTPEKGSVRFLVIDSVEKPSAN
jgi:bla regulator protein blaR1